MLKKFLLFTLLIGMLITSGCLPWLTRLGQKEAPKLPELSFQVEESKALVADKIQGRQEEINSLQEKESGLIVSLLKSYFERAFVKPAYWKKPELESDLRDFFAPSIQEAIKKDLAGLSLAGVASKIETPTEVEAKIPRLWITYDGSLSPNLAAAQVFLEINYQLKERGSLVAEISGDLLLEPKADGGWQIYGYHLKRQFFSEEKDLWSEEEVER